VSEKNNNPNNFRKLLALTSPLVGSVTLSACGAQNTMTIEVCGKVIDRLDVATTEFDSMRFFLGDGGISSRPATDYYLQVENIGTVEVEVEEYLRQQEGTTYCEKRRVSLEER
jgi:hypothetical protein